MTFTNRASKDVSRSTFLAAVAGSSLLSVSPNSIDWRFPGFIAAYARRLVDDAPFVSHNENAVLPAASVIKLLIFLAVARQIDSMGLSWEQAISLDGRDIVGGSETFGSARGGERISLARLAEAMIERSDNSAANALADWVGFARVNDTATAIGLKHTALRRHFMDFHARAEGVDNTTTARDIGMLLTGVANGMKVGFARVRRSDCQRLVRLMLAQEDRETIPEGLYRPVRIANKTGELPDVRDDVAIVGVGDPESYVMVLLSAQVADRPLAFRRLRQLAKAIDELALARRRQTCWSETPSSFHTPFSAVSFQIPR